MENVRAFVLVLAILLSACGESSKRADANMEPAAAEYSASATADSSAAAPMMMEEEKSANASSAPPAEVSTNNVPAATQELIKKKKFIITADVRAKVKNLRKTNTRLEQLVRSYGGYMESSGMNSSINRSEDTPVSRDSILQSTYYQASLHATVRVPVENFDSLMNQLDRLYFFVDARNIKSEDVSLMLLRNRMNIKRLAAYNQRMSNVVDKTQNKKNTTLDDLTNAENNILDKNVQSDENALRNMELEDRIMLSTITLDLYQQEDLLRTMIANHENIAAYEPSFFEQLWNAAGEGYRNLLEVLVGLMEIWWLIAIVGALVYWWLKRRKQNVG